YTGGEQYLLADTIHGVLATVPAAQAGTKGLMPFLVAEGLVNAEGSLGEKNSLGCGSIEHKMGIKASATCVMNFDGARGWLLGQANQGLACMFTMMNDARFQVGLQGLGIAERAFQGALGYACELLQSRALVGPQAPDKVAHPITLNPYVWRMLPPHMTLVECSRLLVACCSLPLRLLYGH
ncbi:acyl-CoA dehydrogenase, partial [Staphylococcus aureus]|nr:acyl-CoA dehydrogenase [Staphylococcus aureus]